MQLDLVHDIQAVYRKTVDSMARPGLITNIHEQAAKLSLSTGAFNSSLILALMLFDTETKFKVYSLQETEITKWIKNDRLRYLKVLSQPVEIWLSCKVNFSLNFIDIAAGFQPNEGWKRRPHPVRFQVTVTVNDIQKGHREKYFVLQR